MRGLSLNSGTLSKFDLHEAMDILANEGYQGIDISLEKEPPFFPVPKPHMAVECSVDTRKAVRKHAEELGIEIVALNAHTNPINPFPEKRKLNREFLKGAVQLASDLEAKYVVVGSGRKEHYGTEASYMSWLIDVLRELVEDATHAGVTLAFEVGGLPGVLIHNVSRLQSLLQEEGLEALRVLCDPANAYIRGDNIGAWSAVLDKIVHVHCKDAKGFGDIENFEFPPLGAGEINFPSLIDLLFKANYRGYLVVEDESFVWDHQLSHIDILRNGKQVLGDIIKKYS